MKKIAIANSLIYRWRYGLGYAAIGFIVISLLAVASLYIPGGITDREISSTTGSATLSISNFTPEMAVQLPYHLLQRASFVLLGVSEMSIKLPTIILSFTSIVGIILLLNIWFRRNIAVLTAIVAITTGPFLLTAQSGSPGIMYIFWPVWILLSASMVTNSTRLRILWKIMLFVSIALSLYTPLSIYIIIALIAATIFHPHLRHVIKSLSYTKISIAALVGLILTVPLAYSIYKDPGVIIALMGIPASIDLMANLNQLYQQYLVFNKPSNGIIMTPVYELASILLVLIGIYQMLSTKHTAKSYAITAWLILLIPVLLVNPNLVNVTFVPLLILMGYGVTMLVRSWYKLFPKNPYARVAGLIPLCIFIISLTLSGVDRFVYGYLYSPQSSLAVTKDLRLLTEHMKGSDDSSTILTTEKEYQFYETIRIFNTDWPIKDVIKDPRQGSGTTIATNQAYRAQEGVDQITQIITDSSRVDGDRLYIYKNTAE